MYGEWLREQFDKGAIPEPTYDPDLAILLSQLREKTAKVVRFQVDYYLTKIKPHIPSGHTVRTEKQT